MTPISRRLWLFNFCGQLFNFFFAALNFDRMVERASLKMSPSAAYNFSLGAASFFFALIFVAFFIPSFRKEQLSERTPNTKSSAVPQLIVLRRVEQVLNALALFLPSRIMKEDAGDAREVIDKLVADSAPTWMIYTKLVFSVFWILLAAAREVLTVTKKNPN